MIYLYSGTPGGGKSYHAVERIRDLNRLHKQVIISTLAIDKSKLKYPDRFFYIELDKLTPSFLVGFYYSNKDRFSLNSEGSIFLIVDEAQRIFNARDYQKPDRRAWLDFFTIHRHFYYSIILISQWDYMLDKQIRALIEIEIQHRRLKHMGFWGKFLEFFFHTSMFLHVECYYGLSTSSCKLGSGLHLCKKSVYRLYDTHSVFQCDLPMHLKADLESKKIQIM